MYPQRKWPHLKMQNVFPKMSKTQGQIRWPGPEEIGAHNNDVYKDLLGLSDEDLQALKNKSII